MADTGDWFTHHSWQSPSRIPSYRLLAGQLSLIFPPEDSAWDPGFLMLIFCCLILNLFLFLLANSDSIAVTQTPDCWNNISIPCFSKD